MSRLNLRQVPVRAALSYSRNTKTAFASVPTFLVNQTFPRGAGLA